MEEYMAQFCNTHDLEEQNKLESKIIQFSFCITETIEYYGKYHNVSINNPVQKGNQDVFEFIKANKRLTETSFMNYVEKIRSKKNCISEKNQIITELISSVDKNGQTPIFYVSDQSLLNLFLRYGADINHKNSKGLTPLDNAISRNLIYRGCNLVRLGGKPGSLGKYCELVKDENKQWASNLLVIYDKYFVDSYNQIICEAKMMTLGILPIYQFINASAHRFIDPKQIMDLRKKELLGNTSHFFDYHDFRILPLKVMCIQHIYEKRKMGKEYIEEEFKIPRPFFYIESAEKIIEKNKKKRKRQ